MLVHLVNLQFECSLPRQSVRDMSSSCWLQEEDVAYLQEEKKQKKRKISINSN